MVKPAPAEDDSELEGDDAILAAARKAYDRAREAWQDNQDEAKDDLKFARLGGDYQWHEGAAEKRRQEGRPAESFNKMPAFIRQVVNDARQNKPAIKVHPQDSGADPRTAEIINGLIRNIETASDADVAYDTAIEHAVGQGFGFWRINTAYTCDDAFDQDIVIERIINPFTVFGDPRSTAADSSDWNVAFVVETMSKDEFKQEYPGAERTDWAADFKNASDWLDGDSVTVAEYWTREKVKSEIVALDDGTVVKTSELDENPEDYAERSVVGEPREVESYKVTQRIITGAEVLKTVEWAGKYIPIVPVYGDEVTDDEGKRHYRSLIRDAKGSQRMFNYMRNTGIEGLGLQPRVPYIGEEGSFVGPGWDTANSQSHSYLEYKKGAQPPQRQPLPSHYAAAAQEALIAADDMKSAIGIYDAGLGARSNETSGRAINARKMESDVSTFHFIDNLSRAIRHGGRILIDLIPKVYSTERMVRILGEDQKPQNVKLSPTGQPVQEVSDEQGGFSFVYDLTAGKYDLTVKAGPSFTTRREEAREEIVEIIRNVPDAAPILGPMYLRNSDWPGAEEAADRLEGGGQEAPQIPPEVQQQIQEGMQLIQQLQGENEQLKGQQGIKGQELQLKAADIRLKEIELEIARVKAQAEMAKAQASLIAAQNPPPPSGFAAAA